MEIKLKSLKQVFYSIFILVFFLAFTSHVSCQTVDWTLASEDCNSPEKSIATDYNGNVYAIKGFSDSTCIPGNHGGAPSRGPHYLTKISSHGTLIWKRYFNVSLDGIKVDSSGTCYLNGRFLNNTTIGPYQLYNSEGHYIHFLARISSSGDVEWAQRFGSRIFIADVLPVKGNKVIVLGSGSLSSQPFGPFTVSPGESFLSVISDSGVVESLTTIANGGGSFKFLEGEGNNLFVAGTLGYGNTFGSGTNSFTVNDPNASRFIAKFDSTFQLSWINTGTDEADLKSLAVDHYGNSYLFGTQCCGNGPFLERYFPSGIRDWIIQSVSSGGGVNLSQGNAVVVDAFGDCYVSGRSEEPFIFGNKVIGDTTLNYPLAFLMKVTASETVAWVLNNEITNEPLGGEGLAICIDNIGNIYVTGNSGPYLSDTFLSKVGQSPLTIQPSETAQPFDINVYPNPTTGLFYIANFKSAKYHLLDQFGRKVEPEVRSENDVQSIDISKFPSGIYYLVTAEEGFRSVKLLKN